MNKEELYQSYVIQKQSMQQISTKLGCSLHKVVYWMNRYGIVRRSRPDAMYQYYNPDGDPFTIKMPVTAEEYRLYGLGLGLFWGEGNKASLHSVRLGNTDPALIRKFMDFLILLCGVPRERLRFSLQIFSDIDPNKALSYWVKELGVLPVQFGQPTVTISGSIGTYKTKCQYGVATVNFHNRKLRDILVNSLPR